MDKPKRPRKGAGENEWDAYHAAMRMYNRIHGGGRGGAPQVPRTPRRPRVAQQPSEPSGRGAGKRQDGTGDRWHQGDMTFTVNNTNDPAAGEDGYYVSMQDSTLEEDNHATAVYDANGNLVDFKPHE